MKSMQERNSKIAAGYNAGASTVDLAKEHNLSPQRILQILLDEEVKIRRRGRPGFRLRKQIERDLKASLLAAIGGLVDELLVEYQPRIIEMIKQRKTKTKMS